MFPPPVLISLSPFLIYGTTAFLGKGESAPVFPEGALIGVVASPGAAMPTANSSSTTGPRADISVNRYFRVDVMWVTQNFLFFSSSMALFLHFLICNVTF